jgi:hypothetical protein
MTERLKNLNIVLPLLIFIGLLYIPVLTSANYISPTWTDTTQNPTLQTGPAIGQAEYSKLLAESRGYHHQECVKKKIPTRTKSYVQHYDGCWYATSIGLLEKDGKYLLQPGASVAGYVRRETADNSKLSPTPNPDVFLELVDDAGTGYGYFVNLRTTDNLELDKQVSSSTGSITLTYKNPGKRIRRDTNSIHTESSFIWYSNNAQWMVIWGDNNSYAYRVDLSTFEIQAVYIRDKPSGFYLKGHASISNDGSYIAVSLYEGSFRELYIQDLNNCTSTGPFTYLESLKCKSRTLKTFLQGNITGYTAAYIPRFYNNDMLGFYHQNTDKSYTLYTLQAPHTNTEALNYLAMGDSFASGEGAFDYEDGTDDPVNKCHLSKKSYPHLINQQMALGSFRSIACSGAKIENVIGGNEEENQNELPAYISEKSHPGYYRQLRNLKEVQPNTITISMSGNDIGFADKVKYCVAYANDCFNTYEDRLEIIREINSKFDAITDMYRQIKQTTAPNTKIYVIGYPQIVSSDINDKCGANVHLSAQERLFANQLITYFNKVIKNAAAKEGVFYVGIEGSLNGSRLCEINDAGIAVNGITIGNDSGIGPLKIIGQESYHPNATGHLFMKNAVLEKTDFFTKSMPSPDPTSTAPDETDTPLLQAPKSGRKINKTNYDGNPKNNVYYHNGWITETVDASIHKLVPFKDYFVELHSEPIKLGTVTTDINGDLALNLQIPETIPPGMHTLHIYGKNTDGEDIDIYRYIYVGASETDFDGDDIPDNQEACIAVAASGTDEDQDGVDDACDSIITLSDIPSKPSLPVQQPDETTASTGPMASRPVSLRPNFSFLQQPVTPHSNVLSHSSTTPTVLSENTINPKLNTNTSHNSSRNNPNSATSRHPETTRKFNIAPLATVISSLLFISVSIMVYAKSKRKL